MTVPWKFALIGALAALVMLAGPARAGTYDVYSCDPSHAGGATPSWNGFHDVGLTVYSQCTGASPDGIVTRSVAAGGATSTGFQGAFAVLDAPAGTTIDSIHGYFYIARPGCNWGAGIKATSGDLGGRWVYALQPGYCGADSIGWVYWDWPINDKRIVELVICGASTCDRSSEARAAMRNVRVTISDPTPPDITSPRGELWTSAGWLAGSREVGFDASDGAGIRRDDIRIDDQVLSVADFSCDDTLAAPCPNRGYDASVDTSKIAPDGPHKLTLEAVDSAGNPTQISKTIQVDNTAPIAPEGLAVDGGDGWRTGNDFSISWTHPAATGGAPIAAAEHRLCPTSGAACTTGSDAGDDLTSLKDIQAPGPGDWTFSVWLRDAAGNANPDASSAVRLRYDPTAPTVAFEAPNPSDPTLVSVRATDGESSVADAHIEIRRHGTQTWRTLPSTYDGSHVTARLDDEHLASGSYDLKAWARDAAGNERTSTEVADGGAAAVRLPVRVVTQIKAGAASRTTKHRHRRTAWDTRLHLRFGRGVRLGGRLMTADGNPIAGSEVLVHTRERRPNTPWVAVAALKTSRRGYFAYRAPQGASRTVGFRFGGTATIRPSIRLVQLIVPAKSTIHVKRAHLINGEYVHLRGRVLGGVIPHGGKLVEIQVLLRGQWHTFATTRTGDGGRWRYEYRFDGTRGHQTYRLRVRVPQESGFPYAVGRSKSLAIRVRGW